MSRRIKIVDTFSGGADKDYTADVNITWADFCELYPEFNGKRAKVGRVWSGSRGEWVLSDTDTLPDDDGLTIFIIETRTKAGN